jgi:hypothetical protein
MRKVLFLLFVVVALSGCLHSQEHLTINADGSGTVEVHLKVHTATMQMLDQMLGGMMQAFASMGKQMGANNTPPPAPVSVAEQMFSDKEQILKKIRKSGATAEFESFNSEKKADGLYVDYKVKVSDVLLLSKGEGLGTKVRLMRNAQGDWFCRLIGDPEKQKESLDQKAQLERFKSSPQFQGMPADTQQKMMNSFMDLRIEFAVTFPAPVTEMSGMFEKGDDTTAGVKFGMDMMMDPQALAKMASSAKDQMVRTGTGPVPETFFDLAPGEVDDVVDASEKSVADQGVVVKTDKVPTSSQPAASGDAGKVKIYLKSGNVIEARLIEKRADFIKIDFEGTPITYYNDEVERME